MKDPIKKIKNATDWEEVFVNHIFDRRLVSWIHKDFFQTQQWKIEQFNLKTGKRHEHTFH